MLKTGLFSQADNQGRSSWFCHKVQGFQYKSLSWLTKGLYVTSLEVIEKQGVLFKKDVR